MKKEQNLQEPQKQALNIPVVSRCFTIEDMKEAFIYGRKSEFSYQYKLELTPYISFEQWFSENYD